MSLNVKLHFEHNQLFVLHIYSKSVMPICCELWTTQNSRFNLYFRFRERMLIFKFFLCCQGREGQEKIKQIFWSAILMIVPDKNPDKTETKYFESWWSTAQPIITLHPFSWPITGLHLNFRACDKKHLLWQLCDHWAQCGEVSILNCVWLNFGIGKFQ